MPMIRVSEEAFAELKERAESEDRTVVAVVDRLLAQTAGTVAGGAMRMHLAGRDEEKSGDRTAPTPRVVEDMTRAAEQMGAEIGAERATVVVGHRNAIERLKGLTGAVTGSELAAGKQSVTVASNPLNPDAVTPRTTGVIADIEEPKELRVELDAEPPPPEQFNQTRKRRF